MSKEFKVGDRVKFVYDARRVAPQNKSDPNYGRIGTVVRRHGNGLGVWVMFDGDSRENGWHYDWRFESAGDGCPFSAGDVVTPNGACGSLDTFTRGREYTVTRTRKSGGGYTIYLATDDTGNAIRFRPHVEFDLVRKAGEAAPEPEPTPYYLVSSPVQKFDTPHATKEAAKEWITEYGTPGVEYKLHRVYDEGTFSVVRELKEAA